MFQRFDRTDSTPHLTDAVNKQMRILLRSPEVKREIYPSIKMQLAQNEHFNDAIQACIAEYPVLDVQRDAFRKNVIYLVIKEEILTHMKEMGDPPFITTEMIEQIKSGVFDRINKVGFKKRILKNKPLIVGVLKKDDDISKIVTLYKNFKDFFSAPFSQPEEFKRRLSVMFAKPYLENFDAILLDEIVELMKADEAFISIYKAAKKKVDEKMRVEKGKKIDRDQALLEIIKNEMSKINREEIFEERIIQAKKKIKQTIPDLIIHFHESFMDALCSNKEGKTSYDPTICEGNKKLYQEAIQQLCEQDGKTDLKTDLLVELLGSVPSAKKFLSRKLKRLEELGRQWNKNDRIKVDDITDQYMRSLFLRELPPVGSDVGNHPAWTVPKTRSKMKRIDQEYIKSHLENLDENVLLTQIKERIDRDNRIQFLVQEKVLDKKFVDCLPQTVLNDIKEQRWLRDSPRSFASRLFSYYQGSHEEFTEILVRKLIDQYVYAKEKMIKMAAIQSRLDPELAEKVFGVGAKTSAHLMRMMTQDQNRIQQENQSQPVKNTNPNLDYLNQLQACGEEVRNTFFKIIHDCFFEEFGKEMVDYFGDEDEAAQFLICIFKDLLERVKRKDFIDTFGKNVALLDLDSKEFQETIKEYLEAWAKESIYQHYPSIQDDHDIKEVSGDIQLQNRTYLKDFMNNVNASEQRVPPFIKEMIKFEMIELDEVTYDDKLSEKVFRDIRNIVQEEEGVFLMDVFDETIKTNNHEDFKELFTIYMADKVRTSIAEYMDQKNKGSMNTFGRKK